MKLLAVVILACTLWACSEPDQPPAVTEEAAQPGETVFDPQLEVLRKAKALEQQILDADEKRKQQMESSGL